MRFVYLSVCLLSTLVWADSDSWFEKKYADHEKYVKKVDNPLYQENCGECHLGYQAALLPQASWRQLMQTEQLENHFGDDASLEESDRIAILNYLLANSVDKPHHSLRITEQSFFTEEHHEIPKKYIVDNPDVKSLSQCDSCHQKASDGIYDDDFVTIPNYGRWDDD